MSLEVITLEPKQPWETLTYVFNLKRSVPSTETYSSVAFAIYDDDNDPASPTDLASTMILGVAYSTANRSVSAQVTGGTSGKTYVLRYRLLCASGNGYEGEGRISVEEVG